MKFVNYQKKYLNSCVELVRDTWNFHESFKNANQLDILYKYYFLSCYNYSEHCELLIDENDTVRGVLFGSIEAETITRSVKYKCHEVALGVWIFLQVMLGHLGCRSTALKEISALTETDMLGEQYAEQFASEINLFIVAKGLRGSGFGRALMDRYVGFCKKNGLKSAFLWTDLDCSFSFYEKYGFRLHSTFYHHKLADTATRKDNGLIFYLDIPLV